MDNSQHQETSAPKPSYTSSSSGSSKKQNFPHAKDTFPQSTLGNGSRSPSLDRSTVHSIGSPNSLSPTSQVGPSAYRTLLSPGGCRKISIFTLLQFFESTLLTVSHVSTWTQIIKYGCRLEGFLAAAMIRRPHPSWHLTSGYRHRMLTWAHIPVIMYP